MLSYDMDKRGNASRYDYLYRRIRHDIARGNILPDEKLPSKRALARNLGVSVITVEAAYAQLIAEGYVRAEERRGYFACGSLPFARRAMRGAMRWAARRRPPARDRSVWRHPRKRDSVALSRLCGLDAVSRCLPRAKARVPRHFGADGRGRSDLRFGRRPGDSRTFVRVGGNGAFPLSNLGPRDATDACGGVFRNARASRSRRRVSALASGNCRLPARIPRHGCPRRAHRRRCGIEQTLYQLIIQLLGRERAFAIESPGVSAARVHVRCPGRALRERSACGGRHRRRCIE